MKLKDKSAIVTGAASGIGKEIPRMVHAVVEAGQGTGRRRKIRSAYS